MSASPSFLSRLRSRIVRAARWTRPVLTHRYLWLGLAGTVIVLVALYLLVNSVLLPSYTRQGVAVEVPEVRNLEFDQAVAMLEDRNLEPERRDQPFNPSLPLNAVVDQNPQPQASVKPGRRIYLYVNSGARRIVTVPDVRNETRLNAEETLASIGLTNVEIRQAERPSPNRGTVTRQSPEPGRTMGAESRVTLYISQGLGDETVTVPDVRGLAPIDARRALTEAGLWIDPTRTVGGTVTRHEPAAGAEVREGTEVRIYSEPLEPEAEAFPATDAVEGSEETGSGV